MATTSLRMKKLTLHDWASTWPILQQLRGHLVESEALELWQAAAYESGYSLWGAEVTGSLVGLLGGRILVDFVHGRHFYIDDLVVADGKRSSGAGAKMLHWAESYAREQGCKGLRLCTGVDNAAGIRFYERENWRLRAHAFKKQL